MTASQQTLPELRVTVFSDYICPFCYIGFVRLEKLRAQYDLKVNWSLVEIHPDNPETARPVSELGYSATQLDDMGNALTDMAKEEGITMLPHTMTTNSRRALLMAEASKQQGKDVFYTVHQRIFEAYFSEGKNIADTTVLQDIATEAGLNMNLVEKAWNDPACTTQLQHNLRAAIDLEVTGTPTYFIGEKKLTGAVTLHQLFAAAEQAGN